MFCATLLQYCINIAAMFCADGTLITENMLNLSQLLLSLYYGNISALSILAEDVEEGRKSCIRVNNPPGGRSAGGFW